MSIKTPQTHWIVARFLVGWAASNPMLSFIFLGLICTSGCNSGGSMSQSDLMRYGISRSDDEEEEQNAAQPAESQIASAPSTPPSVGSSANPSAPGSGPAAVPPAGSTVGEERISSAAPATSGSATSAPGGSVASTTAGDLASSGTAAENDSASPSGTEFATEVPSDSTIVPGMQTIDQRKPLDMLPETQRRDRSARSMQRVTKALVDWIENNRSIPMSVAKDSRGLPGLSWRVQLLPLLGYDALYKKFNLKEPWDSPTNKALLNLIPDEFVSPERFDENTNFQLVVNGTALFSDSQRKDLSDVSDAPNIVMLVEVDDQLAVPWTAPFDYEMNEEPLNRGLGHLRSDGVFVGWMNGSVSVWPNPISVAQLKRAITFEAGDAMPFAPFMKYPPPNPGGVERPAFAGPVSSAAPLTPLTSQGVNNTTVNSSASGELAYTPVSMPARDEIIESEKKIRETYETSFKQARTPVELAKLAKLIHTQVTEGAPPPADVWVGLRTAMNVAVRGRDARLAMNILQELKGRFTGVESDLDAMLLKGFLGDGGSLRTELAKATVLLPLLEDFIDAQVRNDDFRGAAEFIGYGSAVVRVVTDRESAYKWKVLKERVDAGKRTLPKIAKQIETLSENPEDPDANLAVGWYFCVIKGNWNEGLVLLAKSDDQKLRTLAQLETQDESSINLHLRLGDGWWDYANDHKDQELVFEAAMQRARKWYTSASIGLNDGLDRIRANNRLDNIDRLIGKAPDLDDVSSNSN